MYLEFVYHTQVGGAYLYLRPFIIQCNPPTGRSEQGLVGVTTPQQHLPDPTAVLHLHAVSDITVQHTRCVSECVWVSCLSITPVAKGTVLADFTSKVKESWQTPVVTIVGNYSKEKAQLGTSFVKMNGHPPISPHPSYIHEGIHFC